MIKKIFSWQNLLRYLPLLLFVYILWRVDLKKTWDILKETDLWQLGLGFLFLYPLVLCKSWRWQYLLKMQNIAFPLNSAFRGYLASILLGNFTPARAGDFARIFYLKQERSVSFGKGFSSVLVDRLLDLGVLMLLGALGVVIFSMSKEIFILVAAAFAALGGVAVVMLSRRLSKPFFNLVFKKTPLKRFQHGAMAHYDSFFEGIQDFKKLKLIIPVLLSFLSYVFFFGTCYCLALSLRFPISLSYVVLTNTICNVVSVLPVSVAGVGTCDACLIGLFKAIHLGASEAMAYRFLLFFVFQIVLSLWGGLTLLRHPLPLDWKKKVGEE